MRRLVPAALAALVVSAVLAAAAAAEVPNPAVEGPVQGGVRGYPWNHSLVDLGEFGYSENEYFYGGTAKNLPTGATAPYKSRMLVRLPQDARKFNGTVIVEWLNVTGQSDLETAWPPAYEYIMRKGYGYVGVSAQLAGVCCGPTTLKGWDPQRYATLAHPSDEFSYDIFSQAIEALRDPAHVDPMRGMKARYVAATGASQSALRLTSFINDGYARGGIDVFNITRGGGPYEDFSVPIVQLNEEAQPAHPPDDSRYVLWEEAGTAHAPAAWWNYIWRENQRDLAAPGTPDGVNMACSVNRGAVDYSSRAMIHWTQRYLTTGKMPPSAPRLERDANGNAARDENGLAKGGLRHPFVQVPLAYNSAEGCPLWGTYRSWSAEKIKSLYPTHASYVAKVRSWADFEVRKGWLLPEDRDDVTAKAKAFDGPWTDGTCYDTYNEKANETGPLSGPVGQTSFDPSLPLGTQTALRDANCNAVVPLGL